MDPTGCTETPQGNVLVVDDEAGNRHLLRDLLEAQGYVVSEAEDGPTALDLASRLSPHVVLLDVMMPGPDGIEVCRRLKAHPATAPIPVLLVSALSDRDDRLRGIEAGASDFLSKPIDLDDVVLRVRNAVRSRLLHNQVQESLVRLQELESLRDNLIHMVIHDMRSPLQGIFGNLELLEASVAERLGPDDKLSLHDAMASTRVLIEMVSSLLDISRLEAGRMPLRPEPCDLVMLAGDTVHWMGGLFHDLPVTLEAPAEGCRVYCDKAIVRRILSNLLGNAVKVSPRGGRIVVRIEPLNRAARLSVTDQGPGVPPECHAGIFEKFGQVGSPLFNRSYSSGLGLTFCKLAVEAHGGRIGLDSAPGRGSTFWFVLPA